MMMEAQVTCRGAGGDEEEEESVNLPLGSCEAGWESAEAADAAVLFASDACAIPATRWT